MIAIGLACDPKLIIADEPTTALDVTIQAQILELMKDLSRRLDIALILITHNLGIVARYADRVAVMYAARIVESGTAEAVFSRPRHPYTMGLLRSVPRLDRARQTRLATIEGLPPDLANAPLGCRFAPRCPFAIAACAEPPHLSETDTGGLSACHRWEEIAAGTLREVPAEPAPARLLAAGGPKEIMRLEKLTKTFEVRRGIGRKPGIVRAVEQVSLSIGEGETLGLVGESGCGKSTLGRLILGLEEPTSGTIAFEGKDITAAPPAERRRLRRDIQVIFQDPFLFAQSAHDSGQHRRGAVEGLRSAQGRQRAAASGCGNCWTRSVSARTWPNATRTSSPVVSVSASASHSALAMEPRFIVCDEAVSALDVSIQGQIINLLERLQAELGLTFLFIAHDLAVVRHISTRVAVMYLGRVMEIADRDAIYAEPLHPYTKVLLDAAPVPDPEVEKTRAPRIVNGDLPSPLSPPPGCVFHTRCPIATEECRRTIPEPREIRPGHFAACIKVEAQS